MGFKENSIENINQLPYLNRPGNLYLSHKGFDCNNASNIIFEIFTKDFRDRYSSFKAPFL